MYQSADEPRRCSALILMSRHRTLPCRTQTSTVVILELQAQSPGAAAFIHTSLHRVAASGASTASVSCRPQSTEGTAEALWWYSNSTNGNAQRALAWIQYLRRLRRSSADIDSSPSTAAAARTRGICASPLAFRSCRHATFTARAGCWRPSGRAISERRSMKRPAAFARVGWQAAVARGAIGLLSSSPRLGGR